MGRHMDNGGRYKAAECREHNTGHHLKFVTYLMISLLRCNKHKQGTGYNKNEGISRLLRPLLDMGVHIGSRKVFFLLKS